MRLSLMLPLVIAAQSIGAQQSPVENAKAEFFAGRYESAKTLLAPRLAANRDDPEANYLMGRALLARRDAKGAMPYFERAVDARPNEALYRVWYGRAIGDEARAANMLRQPAMISRSKEQLEKAVSLAPDDLEARKAMSEFYAIVPAMFGGGKAKAREQAAEIGKRNRYQGYIQMAWVLADGNDPQGAERQLLEAVQLYPDSAAVVHALADLYLFRMNRQPEGFRIEEAFSAKHPHEPIAAFYLGRAAVTANMKLDIAEKALRSYLTYFPKYGEPTIASAHYRLGQMYVQRGDKTAARTELETALKLDPGLTLARTALAAVK